MFFELIRGKSVKTLDIAAKPNGRLNPTVRFCNQCQGSRIVSFVFTALTIRYKWKWIVLSTSWDAADFGSIVRLT